MFMYNRWCWSLETNRTAQLLSMKSILFRPSKNDCVDVWMWFHIDQCSILFRWNSNKATLTVLWFNCFKIFNELWENNEPIHWNEVLCSKPISANRKPFSNSILLNKNSFMIHFFWITMFIQFHWNLGLFANWGLKTSSRMHLNL